MKILLHICCGPCSIYPFFKLKEEGYEVTGFFYNPNIHPKEEFLKRRDALSEFARKEDFEVVYFEYLPADFFACIEPYLPQFERCPKCWELRLLKIAFYAKEHNFPFFSTTLLGSPYQDHGKIRALGEEISREQGIEFLYQDFRIGFRDAQNKAKGMGLYRQKYCGCIYSQIEREEALRSKAVRCKE